MALYNSILDLIGNTPMLRLGELNSGGAEVLVKLESSNPLSSVKDRIGLAMIKAAEDDGRLAPGAPVIEATSGNTGIALALAGNRTGHPVILTMPETMSVERRRLLQALGARLELTSGSRGMSGAVQRAEELLEEHPGAFMTRQFENPANPEIHYHQTAREIWEDCDGQVDVLVSGVGTGGTITGTGRRLRELNPDIEIVAVEPRESPVISGGVPGPHQIQGIGSGFIPPVLDTGLISRVLPVAGDEAAEASRNLARQEGIIAGISAGANVHAALTLSAEESYSGKRIVTFICDSGERYLSTWLYRD